MDKFHLWEIVDEIEQFGIDKWKETSYDVLDLAFEARGHIRDELPPENEELKQMLLNEFNYQHNQYLEHPHAYDDIRTVPISNRVSLTREYLRRTKDYIFDMQTLITELINDDINIFDYLRKRSNLYRKLYMRLYYRLHKETVRERSRAAYYNRGASRRVLDTYRDTIPIREFNNPHRLPTKAGVMYYPDAEQLVKSAQLGILAIESKHHKREDKDYSAMVSLQISGAHDTHVIASSIKVRLVGNDKEDIPYSKIHSDLEDAIMKLVVTIDDYSYVDEVQVMSAYVTVTGFAFYNALNWFPKLNLETGNQFWRIDGATIYLAAHPSKPCEQMCVEFLGGTYNPDKQLSEQIPQHTLITYFPKTGNIRDVVSINDLVVVNQTNEQLSSTTDCKNIARIVKANEHMGVISKIVPKKLSNKTAQSYRPIDTNKRKKYVEIFFDIEAYQDQNDDPSVSVYYQKPYLLCWSSTLDNNVHSIVGTDCCENFVNTLLTSFTNKTLVLYAWFGSGYDYHHVLKHLIKSCNSASYVLKNTSIMTTSIKFEHQQLTIVTKDPFLFMLTSLHKAAKAFNVTNKSDFPHNAISKMSDLNVVLDHWYTTKTSVIAKYPEYANTNMEVYREITNIYEQDKNDKTILEHAIDYCKIDVIAMKEIWIKFQSLMYKTFNVNVSFETFTLSQLSMRLLESNLPKNVRLVVPTTDEYLFYKQAIYGGRVVAKNGYYNEPILYADVVSLYPSAMKLLEHAYGEPYITTSIDWSKHGIYLVTLTHKCNTEPPNFMQFVPRRSETGKLSWTWFKQHTAIYHTYDLLIAKDLGYNISVTTGYEFPKKGFILDTFVSKLFDLKNTHSQCQCPEQPCPIRMIAKIALNGGGYGKFVQRPVLKTTYIVQRDVVANMYATADRNPDGKIRVGDTYVNPPDFYNLDGEEYDKMVIEQDDIPRYSTPCGISILSGSRYRLYQLCKQFPNMQVIYSDTDSIFVKKSSVDATAFANACGSSLGSLDNTVENSKNNTISKMIILGPKMYAYKYYTINDTEHTTFHAKGVPTSMLTWEQYEHIAKSPSHDILFYFDTISRRITSVATRNLKKRITQT